MYGGGIQVENFNKGKIGGFVYKVLADFGTENLGKNNKKTLKNNLENKNIGQYSKTIVKNNVFLAFRWFFIVFLGFYRFRLPKSSSKIST